jgi:hypothetical protein
MMAMRRLANPSAAAPGAHPAPPDTAEASLAASDLPARMRWRWIDGLVGATYLGAAVLVMGRMWVDPQGRIPLVNRDQTLFEWMLVHSLRVITVGDSPLSTAQLNAPLGVNLMANTNVLGLGLPMAPLTAWLGPAVVFVLLLTLSLAGTAFAWYYVMSRHFVGDRLAAFIGGAICGFGPGIITHATGHPNLTAQFLLPLIIWRTLALRSSLHATRDGAILGALVAYQAFINEELLALTVLALAVFVVAYVIWRPALIRTAARPVLGGLAVATFVAGAVLAYPLWYQFSGPGHVVGLPLYEENFPFRLPLVSYVTLPSLSVFGDAAANRILARPTEENSFFGWPVIVLTLVIVAVLWRRRPAVRALFVVGVIFAYASLGNGVSIQKGNQAYRGPSLWRHVSGLPVFDSVLPTRSGLVVLPVVGLLFAFAVADARKSLTGVGAERSMDSPRKIPNRQATTAYLRKTAAIACLAAIVAALVTIVPRQIATVTLAPPPRFFSSGTWRQYVPRDFTVLNASPRDTGATMRWSVAAGLNFGEPGGYFFGPDQTGRARYGPVPRPTASLLAWSARGHVIYGVTPAKEEQAVADLRYWHVAIIVLAPNQVNAAALHATLDKLVGPAQFVQDVWLWNVLPITSTTVLDRTA